jgi:hypothetical protein
MNQEVVDRFIEHHGVKGMRWGVRGGKGKPRRESTDYKKTVPLRNRKTHELSNKQIKTVNERINLEGNYRRLNPTKVEKGKFFAKSLLATATTAATVYTLANSPAGKAAIASGKKLLEKKGLSV